MTNPPTRRTRAQREVRAARIAAMKDAFRAGIQATHPGVQHVVFEADAILDLFEGGIFDLSDADFAQLLAGVRAGHLVPTKPEDIPPEARARMARMQERRARGDA